MDPWFYPLLALAGVVSGILNVLAGGGSLLSLPLLVVLGVPEVNANASNRVAILAQNLAAVSSFRKQGFHHWRLSSSLAAASLPGAVAGSWLAASMSDRATAWLLIGVMAVVLIQSLLPRRGAAASGLDDMRAPARRPWLAHLSMLGVGFYGGLIQAGVGFLLMAALLPALGRGLAQVNMHKVFIVGVYTAVALAVFIWQDTVWWGVGLALAAGTACGGWLGARLAVHKGEAWIKRVYQIALLVFLLVMVTSQASDL